MISKPRYGRKSAKIAEHRRFIAKCGIFRRFSSIKGVRNAQKLFLRPDLESSHRSGSAGVIFEVLRTFLIFRF